MLAFTISTQSGRLDKVIADQYPDFTRSQVQKWLAAGLVQLNGKAAKGKEKVQPGDQIRLDPPAPAPLEAKPEPMPLDIVYEDDQVIVVNKPQGMVVHPAPGHPDGTLVNGLLAHTTFAGINDVLRQTIGSHRPPSIPKLDIGGGFFGHMTKERKNNGKTSGRRSNHAARFDPDYV